MPKAIHYYTDGSYTPQGQQGEGSEAGWAAVALYEREGHNYELLGVMCGEVTVNPDDPQYVGADDLSSANAEATGGIWALRFHLQHMPGVPGDSNKDEACKKPTVHRPSWQQQPNMGAGEPSRKPPAMDLEWRQRQKRLRDD